MSLKKSSFGSLFESYLKFIFWCEIQAIYRLEMLQKWTFFFKKGGKMVNSSLLSKPNYENVEVDFMVIFWTMYYAKDMKRPDQTSNREKRASFS